MTSDLAASLARVTFGLLGEKINEFTPRTPYRPATHSYEAPLHTTGGRRKRFTDKPWLYRTPLDLAHLVID